MIKFNGVIRIEHKYLDTIMIIIKHTDELHTYDGTKKVVYPDTNQSAPSLIAIC